MNDVTSQRISRSGSRVWLFDMRWRDSAFGMRETEFVGADQGRDLAPPTLVVFPTTSEL